MEIRAAVIGEENDVVRLINELIIELGGPPLPPTEAVATVRSFMSDELAGSIIVASNDGDLVGVCTLSFQPSIRTLGKYGIIQEMYVSPNYRSDNIGAKLIETANSLAREAGCPIIELSTPPNGERSENFYRRVGFSQVGVRMRHKIEDPTP